MAVKILIKRQLKEANFKNVSEMLIKLRCLAMEQKGYISSETMWGHDDLRKVAVASMWENIESWNNWKNSDLRKKTVAEFDKLLDGPIQYDIFVLGLYPGIEEE